MNKILLNAALGKKSTKIPLWFMRQAGRYLPEYREYRTKFDTLTMFKTPSIAADITLQPLRRFNLDGAIIYADILLIPDAMGLNLSFIQKEGPHFSKTIRDTEDLKLITPFLNHPDSIIDKLSYVAETIVRVKKEMSPQTTLLGFAGAPFTVASYMIEGKSAKADFFECRKLIYSKPNVFHSLMEVLTEVTIKYLEMQINAGVEVVQLFESWSNALSQEQYREFCLPYTKKIVSKIKNSAPVITFFGQGASLTKEVLEINAQVYGVDWRQNLDTLATQFEGSQIALQGNLDPLVLYSSQENIKEKAEKCLKIGSQYSHGYIFNLGHGLTEHTPLKNVEYLVNLVNNYKLV